MVIFKWLTYGPDQGKKDLSNGNKRKKPQTYISDPPYSPGCAPSVLILFINMMLFKSYEPEKGCKEFMFEGQKELQTALVAIALVCIPVMLLGKPIAIMCMKKEPKRMVLTSYFY